jgi:tetratricopeptide (TPR) repeat protein
MYKLLAFLLVSIIFASCAGTKTENSDGTPTVEKLKSDIQIIDDSLKIYYQQVMNNQIESVPNNAIQKTIDAHLTFYHFYPKDEFSAECLDKVHQLYIQQKLYVKSVEIADTLLAEFPKYKAKKDVLYSVATTYDFMLNDMVKAKKYYEKILLIPKLDKETKENISTRIKLMGMSLDEMIEFQNKKNYKK